MRSAGLKNITAKHLGMSAYNAFRSKLTDSAGFAVFVDCCYSDTVYQGVYTPASKSQAGGHGD